MGWRRIGNHRYFYLLRREGGRVVSEYFGRGESAGRMAQLNQDAREGRDERRALYQAERKIAERDEKKLAAWFDGIEVIANGAMLAAGFYKHHGQWRRRRMAKANDAAEAKPLTTAEDNPPAGMTQDEFEALVKRAESGDMKSFAQLREALSSGDYANGSQWFDNKYGDPVWMLKIMLGMKASGEHRLASVLGAERSMNQVWAELAGPDPSPIERLLAERAAVCWFAVTAYETIDSQSKDRTLRQVEYHLHRIDSAHRRFLSAIATLARVRKLALPAIQFNVARQQVNVAGSS
jgi:hypothetical protein